MKIRKFPSPSSLRTGNRSKQAAGRNNRGRITVRHQGGGHKQAHRHLDWGQTQSSFSQVAGFAYDPRRSAPLLHLIGYTPESFSYSDGRPSYVIATAGVKPLQTVKVHQAKNSTKDRSASAPRSLGDVLPLSICEAGDFVHSVPRRDGGRPRFARAAGTYCQVISVGVKDSKEEIGTQASSSSVENTSLVLRLPSGSQRTFKGNIPVTLGRVSSEGVRPTPLGKAGRARWLGRRPTVRGTARNPVDHPHGGNSRGRPSVTFKG